MTYFFTDPGGMDGFLALAKALDRAASGNFPCCHLSNAVSTR